MQITLRILIFTFCFAAFISCSNKSTGPDPEEAPTIPQLQSEAARPDVSFFQDNQPKEFTGVANAETNNFYSAKIVASTLIVNHIQFYSSFIEAARNEEPSYDNGTWEWSYSYSYEGMSVDMRLTAQDTGGQTDWALYWTLESEEVSFEDYRVLEGTVNNDGTEGSWTFNTLAPGSNEEIPAISYTYQITSDTEKTVTAEYFDESGVVIGTMNYEEDQPDYLLTITNSGSDDVMIYWNTETNEGYFQEGSEQRCWDSNFQDVPCN